MYAWIYVYKHACICTHVYVNMYVNMCIDKAASEATEDIRALSCLCFDARQKNCPDNQLFLNTISYLQMLLPCQSKENTQESNNRP